MPSIAWSLCIQSVTCLAVSRRGLRGLVGMSALLLALFTAQPSSAQKIYSYEPLMMDPYSTIYVNDGSCSAGKVLKVQGAQRNQRRKKSCVPISDLQGMPRSGQAK